MMQRRAWLGWLAATGAIPLATQAQGGDGRVALVVGQSRLPGGGAVASAAADARLIERALKQVDYSVVRLDDPDVGALRSALEQLGARLRASPGLGWLHYSGAGFARPMPGGQAEFWMWSAKGLTDAKAAMTQAVPLDDVWRLVNPGVGRVLVVTVDSAFTWPFGTPSAAGLRWSHDAPGNAAFIFGGTTGNQRAETPDGQHGLFTVELARHVQPDRTVDQLVRAVRLGVLRASGGRQFTYSSMDFDLANVNLGGAGVAASVPIPPAAPAPAPAALPGDDPKGRGRSARVT